MPFYRFEQFESRLLAPHLSSGAAPVIEGRYMYFCLLHKEAGTGSELHYHPNELFIETDGERKRCGPGDIAHTPRGSAWSLSAAKAGARCAVVQSTAWLEHRIDTMSPEEQARARVERKAS